MVTVRHFFAGSNSALGFYSLFDNIIGPEAKRVYLLKGGPGTGKSHFMKDIAKSLEDEGYQQELFFCSSDSLSLDAVSFPQLGIALIDATAPHAVEARWPGCRDELICFGNFWSSVGLVEKREEIIKGGLAKKNSFSNAFRYLKMAHLLEENIAERNRGQGLDIAKFSGEILARLDAARVSYQSPQGKMRHLFASALTPEGYVSHLENLLTDYAQRYILIGAPGTGKAICLWSLAQHAQRVGLDVEVYHYPLDPKQVLHILVPQLSLALLTSLQIDSLEDIEGVRIDFGAATGNAESNAEDLKMFQEFLNKAIDSLQQAQKGHGQVENFYKTQMDFADLDRYRDQILQEILTYRNLS